MSNFVAMRSFGLAFLVLASVCVTPAFAQATRTWVSGVGDDANPCSRTAPCKTFAGAISKTAAGGEINVIDAGGFGAVTITKSITIDGRGFLSGVLASGTNGIVVNAGVNDKVILRDLDIFGAQSGLNGVRFLAGKELHIERCNIYGFAQKGIDALSTTADHRVFVVDSSIRANANDTNGGGISMTPNGAVGSIVLDGVHLDANKFGLRLDGNARATVRNSRASGSTNGGGFIALNGAEIMLDHSTSSGNSSAGVNAQGSGVIYITDSTITKNNPGIFASSGGQVISFGNNRVIANAVNGSPTSTIAEQ